MCEKVPAPSAPMLRTHYNGKIPRKSNISPNCKEREFLTEDELKAVVTYEFEDDNLAFVCFTALSFIDVKNLTMESVSGIGNSILCEMLPYQEKRPLFFLIYVHELSLPRYF